MWQGEFYVFLGGLSFQIHFILFSERLVRDYLLSEMLGNQKCQSPDFRPTQQGELGLPCFKSSDRVLLDFSVFMETTVRATLYSDSDSVLSLFPWTVSFNP